MTTQAQLISRLRRLIDDTGHGYSQSGPGFAVDLTDNLNPGIQVQVDAEIAPREVSLGASSFLTTGPAIAAAIQRGVRALDPAFSNFSVTFDQRDGYVLRSGLSGSTSRILVLPSLVYSDCSAALKLGKSFGGYETEPSFDFSDAELGELLDDALATQNAVGVPSLWQYETIPQSYETLVAYRAWSSVVDVRLGRSAELHWQKVEAEEQHGDQIFANYLKLAGWLKNKIDSLQESLDGLVEVTTMSRWSIAEGSIVPGSVFSDKDLRTSLLEVSWLSATEALVEFGEILSANFLELSLGYKLSEGVIDRAAYNEDDYDPATRGFTSPAKLARTLRNGRNTLVRIAGLDSTKDTYFAAVILDQDGNRYFTNEMRLAAQA